jgi:hypothetical protein
VRILIVTKDPGSGFSMHYPVAVALRELGHEVSIVAEGLSAEMWIKASWDIAGGLPKEGDFDPKTKIRHDINPWEVIFGFNPDVVITELADPIHLGEQFGLVANERGIPLGFIEDLWFAHRRSLAFPDFVCTVDSYGEKAILDNLNYKCYSSILRVFVTGSPLMDSLKSVTADPRVKAIIEKQNPSRVILVAGQGDCTTSVVSGLADALEKMTNCLILPRFHPKWMSDPSKAAIRNQWTEDVFRMEMGHRVLWTPPSVSLRSLIPLATDVVSMFSNALIEALALGAMPVSWTSPEIVEEIMKGFAGASHFPMVDMVAAYEVSITEDYLRLTQWGDGERHGFIKHAQKTMNFDFRATERVVDAIVSVGQK